MKSLELVKQYKNEPLAKKILWYQVVPTLKFVQIMYDGRGDT